ncbi:MAG: hypothetical protein ACE5JD_00985 [Candidatus Methylomirabilia bacterium]
MGCLTLTVILVGIGVVLGGGLIFSTNIFHPPENLSGPVGTSRDGRRAQQKMYELVLRDRRLSSRTAPVVFTEREINAFLSRHLIRGQGIPLTDLRVTFTPGQMAFQGQTEIRSLMRGVPFKYITSALPASQLSRRVWVAIRARVRLERGWLSQEQEFLRIDPSEFRLGTQNVGAWLLSWMLGRKFLSWPVPAVIEAVSIQQGRVVVTTRARRSAAFGGLHETKLEVLENVPQELALLRCAVPFRLVS